MSLKGLKAILANVAIVATCATAPAQQVAADQLDDQIVQTTEELRVLQDYRENGYGEAVKSRKVNFASQWPRSGKPLTQGLAEAILLRPQQFPQVAILVVRDQDAPLNTREGNRFPNTAYEQKFIEMAENVGNSFVDPKASVAMVLAVQQEEGIKTYPGDILVYTNDRIDYYSPTSDEYEGMDEDAFVREIAANLSYQFSTGHYQLTEQDLESKLNISRGHAQNQSGDGSSGEGSGGDSAGDQSIEAPVIADNSM